MTPEELKAKADAISAKMDKNESQIANVLKKAEENGELSSNLKESLEGLKESTKNTEKEFKDFHNKYQEQLDDLSAKMKQVSKKDGSVSSLRKGLETSIEGIKAFSEGHRDSVKMELKANMLNSTHTGDIVEQQRLDGVFRSPERSTHVRSFMNTVNQTTENLRYIQETGYTDNVGVRAEGSAGTESNLNLTEQTAATTIISTYFTVSKESLGDLPLLENYIRTRGMGKIMLKEDQQIIYGTGTSNQLSGITLAADAYVDTIADSNVQRFDVMGVGVTQAKVDEYNPNLVLVHPTTYDAIARTKDGNESYMIPDAVFSGRPISVYGANVVANSAVTADDFIVGDFQMGATLGIREDVTVTISNSHASTFTAGMVTILIEERVSLPIYRTDAFIYGDFTTALAQGTA